jgi:hypothetical protein
MARRRRPTPATKRAAISEKRRWRCLKSRAPTARRPYQLTRRVAAAPRREAPTFVRVGTARPPRRRPPPSESNTFRCEPGYQSSERRWAWCIFHLSSGVAKRIQANRNLSCLLSPRGFFQKSFDALPFLTSRNEWIIEILINPAGFGVKPKEFAEALRKMTQIGVVLFRKSYRKITKTKYFNTTY